MPAFSCSCSRHRAVGVVALLAAGCAASSVGEGDHEAADAGTSLAEASASYDSAVPPGDEASSAPALDANADGSELDGAMDDSGERDATAASDAAGTRDAAQNDAATGLLDASRDASSTSKAEGPCDIYGIGGTPCVAAHSTVPRGQGPPPASNTPVTGMAFVTAMLKGPSGNHFTLKAGNAQSGTLATKWDGARPPGYTPMKKEGAIILGTGGDGSDGGDGTFFDGCMTSGNPSNATDDAVQANIVAARYGL
jgi:hypothetical protein